MRMRVARAVLIGLTLLAVGLLGLIVYPFASALLFAAVLATAFTPWTKGLAGRLHGRKETAALLMTIAVAVLIVLPLSALVVVVGRESVAAIGEFSDTLHKGGVPALIKDLPAPLRDVAKDLARALPKGPRQIEELAGEQTGRAAVAMGGVIVATSGLLIQIGLMLVAFYFLLVDGPALVAWVVEVAPIGRGRTRELLADFRNVSEAVFFSSMATAGVQTAVALVGFLIAGVPQPLIFTIATFIVAFVPILGGASVSLACAVLLFFSGHTGAAVFLAVWAVAVVGLSDNIVKPLLMRGRMEVHGAVIFFALVGGLAVFGPAGFIAGPLIVAFFLAVVRMCQRDLREEEDREEKRLSRELRGRRAAGATLSTAFEAGRQL
jgi:predicted PurR-regulated permease PerM